MTQAPKVPPSSIDFALHNLESGRLHCEHMFESSLPVRFEVEVRVGQPLDSTARQFLVSVMRSANKVVAYRPEGEEMVGPQRRC